MRGFLNWKMSFNSFTAFNTFEPVDEIICSDYFQIKGKSSTLLCHCILVCRFYEVLIHLQLTLDFSVMEIL